MFTKLTLQERRAIAAKPSPAAAKCFQLVAKLNALLNGSHAEDIKVPGIDGTVLIRSLNLGGFRGWVAEKDRKGLFIRENGEVLSYDEFRKKAGSTKASLCHIQGNFDPNTSLSIERNLHKNNIAFDKALFDSIFQQLASSGKKITSPSRTGNGIIDATINERGNLVVREMPNESGCLAFHIEVQRNGIILQGRVGEKIGARIEPYDRKPGYRDLEILLNKLSQSSKSPV